MFDWNSDKAEANLAKHGVAFAAVEGFDFDTATDTPDDRLAYGEERRRAIGFIGDRLHALIYTWREGRISLRRANARERKTYAQTKA